MCLRQKIAEGELSYVFDYLVSEIQKKSARQKLSRKEEMVFIQSARLQLLEESYWEGMIGYDDYSINFAKITHWLLNFVNRVWHR